jgi:glycosyltransferase involved in cell wall biosynthesis
LSKKPIVVSPIWVSIGRAMWGSRGTFGVLSKGIRTGEESIKRDMELLRSRNLIVNMGEGNINSDGKGTYNLKWQEDVGNLLNSVDGLLPNSWLELKAVQTDLNWCGNNYEIAHYGVDPSLFLNADPKLFREQTGIHGDFIMQAGRIEPGKNQAMLCWALKKTNIPIVLIGGTKHWPSYADLCREISGEKLIIIDHLPQRVLASAYAAARVHCLVSWMDTCGLVSLEAGLNGIPLVGSTFGHELEYLQNDAWLADPADPNSILKAIEGAWNAGRNSIKPRKMKERILAEYNWERATTATEKIYRQAIGNA